MFDFIVRLSIIRELKKEIPHEDLLYFTDRYHFPYGNKSHQQLYEIILASIKFLENYKPKVIIVASITPSVQILHKVRTRVSSQIIGVMPPLRATARLSKKKHIGIMATEGTIFSQELAALLRRSILVATDITARGIDVPAVGHIINDLVVLTWYQIIFI